MKKKPIINLDSCLKVASDIAANLSDKIEKRIERSTEPTANIKIIGVYKIKPSKNSIKEAAIYHGYEYLLDKKGNYTEKIYKSNFKNLGLVELEVEGKFFINRVQLNTEGTEQVPYLEFYLNENGTDVTFDPSRDNKILSMFKTQAEAFEQIVNGENKRRICFFIHFVYPTSPLLIGEQIFTLPEMTELPNRLEKFVHYVPVG